MGSVSLLLGQPRHRPAGQSRRGHFSQFLHMEAHGGKGFFRVTQLRNPDEPSWPRAPSRQFAHGTTLTNSTWISSLPRSQVPGIQPPKALSLPHHPDTLRPSHCYSLDYFHSLSTALQSLHLLPASVQHQRDLSKMQIHLLNNHNTMSCLAGRPGPVLTTPPTMGLCSVPYNDTDVSEEQA